jgi:hypothetical protein
MTHWRVAQSVERHAVNVDVAGSNPASSARITSGTDLGGQEYRSRSRADTPRGSIPSAESFDQDLAAALFALAVFFIPAVLVVVGASTWLLFFH